jgi:hypothetical protein
LPITPARFSNHLRPGRLCHFRCSVIASIVHDDDLGKEPPREPIQNQADRFGFIKGGDDESVHDWDSNKFWILDFGF